MDVALKVRPAFPATAVQPEGVLEGPNAPLDPGPEAFELFVDPTGTHHALDRQATLFGKGHILHPLFFGPAQVGRRAEYYIDHAGGYSRDADRQGATIIYPDGRRVLNKGGFLWFKNLKVPPMSVIEVPLRPVIEKSPEEVLGEPLDREAETDSSQKDRRKDPREKTPTDS